MHSSTIKLFLVAGEPTGLRTAEMSNWSGKAIAAPRTSWEALLGRAELSKPGIYILQGTDAATGRPLAYVGEAEVLRKRIKVHQTKKDFWVHVIAFVSKDDNLTKAHIRYLEGQLIEEAGHAGRVMLENTLSSGAQLPESDLSDMRVFLHNMRQLLPILGSNLLTPLPKSDVGDGEQETTLFTQIKGLRAKGRRTVDGFLVYKGSHAVKEHRPAAPKRHPIVVALRDDLMEAGALVEEDGHLVFTRDVELTSPSAAAAVIHGGGANGLTCWKDASGTSLKKLEA